MDYYDVAVCLSCLADSIEKSGAEVLDALAGDIISEEDAPEVLFELETNGWL